MERGGWDDAETLLKYQPGDLETMLHVAHVAPVLSERIGMRHNAYRLDDRPRRLATINLATAILDWGNGARNYVRRLKKGLRGVPRSPCSSTPLWNDTPYPSQIARALALQGSRT